MGRSQEDYDNFLKEIADFTLKVGRPLYWHDAMAPWPRLIRGASCFTVRTRQRAFGITAAHVVHSFQTDLAETPTLICQIANAELDLRNTVIDYDPNLDLATFAISEDQLKRSGTIALDCSGDWPPPDPKEGDYINFNGFPELNRVIERPFSAMFGAYGAMGIIDSLSDREIITTHVVERDVPLNSVAPVPPPRYNMSGCSGGPMLRHTVSNGIHQWHPIGIIVGGPGASADGDAATVEIIRARRLHFIRSDGTLDRQNSGWLPP